MLTKLSNRFAPFLTRIATYRGQHLGQTHRQQGHTDSRPFDLWCIQRTCTNILCQVTECPASRSKETFIPTPRNIPERCGCGTGRCKSCCRRNDQTPSKARGSGSSASATWPTDSVQLPAHTLLRHALYTILSRTGGIGDVLAACATACSSYSHVSHLPPLGTSQPPVTPAYTPLSAYRNSKTAPPPPSVFF